MRVEFSDKFVSNLSIPSEIYIAGWEENAAAVDTKPLTELKHTGLKVIWNDNTKSLQFNIEGFKLSNENLSSTDIENTYITSVTFYYGRGKKTNIGFTLYGDTKGSPIKELSLTGGNIIIIPLKDLFPDLDIQATFVNDYKNIASDFDFIEGVWKDIKNIHKIKPEDNKNVLVTKDSFLRSLRKAGADINCKIGRCIDETGKYQNSVYTRRIFKEGTLKAVVLNAKGEPISRYGLGSGIYGGFVQVRGTVEYEEYQIGRDNVVEKVGEGILEVSGVDGIEIRCDMSSSSFNYSIDNVYDRITYNKLPDNIDADEVPWGLFHIELSYLDLTGNPQKLSSNKFKLIQGDFQISIKIEESAWSEKNLIGRSSTYTEGKYPVFMFDAHAKLSGQRHYFTVVVNTEEDITSKNFEITANTSADLTYLKTLFNVELLNPKEIKRGEDNKCYAKFVITSKVNNEEEIPLPRNKAGEFTLIPFKVGLKNTQNLYKTVSVYVIQAAEEEDLCIYNENGEEISELVFSWNAESTGETKYVTVGPKINTTRSQFWNINNLSRLDPNIEIVSGESGELNYDPKTGKTGFQTANKIAIRLRSNNTKTISRTFKPSVMISAYLDNPQTTDLSNWGGNLNSRRTYLNISQRQADKFIISDDRTLTVNQVGTIHTTVRANTSFYCKFISNVGELYKYEYDQYGHFDKNNPPRDMYAGYIHGNATDITASSDSSLIRVAVSNELQAKLNETGTCVGLYSNGLVSDGVYSEGWYHYENTTNEEDVLDLKVAIKYFDTCLKEGIYGKLVFVLEKNDLLTGKILSEVTLETKDYLNRDEYCKVAVNKFLDNDGENINNNVWDGKYVVVPEYNYSKLNKVYINSKVSFYYNEIKLNYNGPKGTFGRPAISCGITNFDVTSNTIKDSIQIQSNSYKINIQETSENSNSKVYLQAYHLSNTSFDSINLALAEFSDSGEFLGFRFSVKSLIYPESVYDPQIPTSLYLYSTAWYNGTNTPYHKDADTGSVWRPEVYPDKDGYFRIYFFNQPEPLIPKVYSSSFLNKDTKNHSYYSTQIKYSDKYNVNLNYNINYSSKYQTDDNSDDFIAVDPILYEQEKDLIPVKNNGRFGYKTDLIFKSTIYDSYYTEKSFFERIGITLGGNLRRDIDWINGGNNITSYSVNSFEGAIEVLSKESLFPGIKLEIYSDENTTPEDIKPGIIPFYYPWGNLDQNGYAVDKTRYIGQGCMFKLSSKNLVNSSTLGQITFTFQPRLDFCDIYSNIRDITTSTVFNSYYNIEELNSAWGRNPVEKKPGYHVDRQYWFSKVEDVSVNSKSEPGSVTPAAFRRLWVDALNSNNVEEEIKYDQYFGLDPENTSAEKKADFLKFIQRLFATQITLNLVRSTSENMVTVIQPEPIPFDTLTVQNAVLYFDNKSFSTFEYTTADKIKKNIVYKDYESGSDKLYFSVDTEPWAERIKYHSSERNPTVLPDLIYVTAKEETRARSFSDYRNIGSEKRYILKLSDELITTAPFKVGVSLSTTTGIKSVYPLPSGTNFNLMPFFTVIGRRKGHTTGLDVNGNLYVGTPEDQIILEGSGDSGKIIGYGETFNISCGVIDISLETLPILYNETSKIKAEIYQDNCTITNDGSKLVVNVGQNLTNSERVISGRIYYDGNEDGVQDSVNFSMTQLPFYPIIKDCPNEIFLLSDGSLVNNTVDYSNKVSFSSNCNKLTINGKIYTGTLINETDYLYDIDVSDIVGANSDSKIRNTSIVINHGSVLIKAIKVRQGFISVEMISKDDQKKATEKVWDLNSGNNYSILFCIHYQINEFTGNNNTLVTKDYKMLREDLVDQTVITKYLDQTVNLSDVISQLLPNTKPVLYNINFKESTLSDMNNIAINVTINTFDIPKSIIKDLPIYTKIEKFPAKTRELTIRCNYTK